MSFISNLIYSSQNGVGQFVKIIVLSIFITKRLNINVNYLESSKYALIFLSNLKILPRPTLIV